VISIDREDDMDRRIFLAGSAALGAAGALPRSIAAARESPVRHILPTVSHDAMLVKVSFIEPQLPPKLMVDGKPVDGAATDGEGLCWDEADDRFVSFPPDWFMLAARQSR
jgi:hypothetical protein